MTDVEISSNCLIDGPVKLAIWESETETAAVFDAAQVVGSLLRIDYVDGSGISQNTNYIVTSNYTLLADAANPGSLQAH